jgi:hypothetical protein
MDLMQHNTRVLMLYRDELSGWFCSFNQYRPDSDEQFTCNATPAARGCNTARAAATSLSRMSISTYASGLSPMSSPKSWPAGPARGTAACFGGTNGSLGTGHV